MIRSSSLLLLTQYAGSPLELRLTESTCITLLLVRLRGSGGPAPANTIWFRRAMNRRHNLSRVSLSRGAEEKEKAQLGNGPLVGNDDRITRYVYIVFTLHVAYFGAGKSCDGITFLSHFKSASVCVCVCVCGWLFFGRSLSILPTCIRKDRRRHQLNCI